MRRSGGGPDESAPDVQEVPTERAELRISPGEIYVRVDSKDPFRLMSVLRLVLSVGIFALGLLVAATLVNVSHEAAAVVAMILTCTASASIWFATRRHS